MTSDPPAPGRARYILGLSCDNRPGIVHAVSGLMVARNCNIASSQQFDDPESGLFFMRVEFESLIGEGVGTLREAFGPVADAHGMTWSITRSDQRQRVLLLVSRFGHCLNDLLFRQSIGALRIDIPAIVSNHRDFEGLAASYGIAFHHIPVTAATKPEAEAELLGLVDELRIDLVVLARYMQVLSDDMCKALDGRAINIHHSFLPSFKGAKPYHQAHKRGVKLIGATAHYVTADLDEGPIIEQEVERVTHEHAPEDLAALGRDAEAKALARAVGWHVERRVFIAGNRTVVFA